MARTLLLLFHLATVANPWDDWWGYSGFPGPDFWGLVNPEWKMCAKGQHQSPINISTDKLLFDPNINQLNIDKTNIPGVVVNSGQLLVLSLNETLIGQAVNVSGGPLGAYRYQLHHGVFHFAKTGLNGSEHAIDGVLFPAEVQFFGFNADLYRNFTEAQNRPEGLVGISVMINVFEEEGGFDSSNPELIKITAAASEVPFKGQEKRLKSVSPWIMMPEKQYYVTYHGSLTYPGCYETVTWILLNKPIYLSKRNLERWQSVLQRTEKIQDTPDWMGDNIRPLKELNQRLLRTNINFRTKIGGSSCPTMFREMYYKSNPISQRKPYPRDASNAIVL